MMALKASIGVFLLRIAVARPHKIIIWSVIIVHEVYSVFFFFLFVLQCRPAAYFWTKYTGGSGTCVNPKLTVDAFYGYSAISCAGDWILGIIPIFIVWNLQMNVRTKVSVACILAVGAMYDPPSESSEPSINANETFSASSATIIRMPYIRGMSNIGDFLWATTDVAIWCTVEVGIGIAASAAATLRPLFRVFFSSSQNASGKASQLWGTPADRPSGYMRSRGMGDGFMLRSDVGQGGGTTTTIRGAGDEESLGRGGGSRGHDSIDKLRGDSESDEWSSGIVKTTKMTQVRD